MHYYQPQFDEDENDERQFNFPGFIGGHMLGHLSNQVFGPPHHGPPPFGPPGSGGNPGGSGFPGGQFPGGQGPGFTGGGQPDGPPNTPPPSFTPTKSEFQTFAVDPGAIRGCLYRFTYVWLRRDAFWFYPVFVGRRSIAGYRWAGFRWVYFGIDLNQIESFQCF